MEEIDDQEYDEISNAWLNYAEKITGKTEEINWWDFSEIGAMDAFAEKYNLLSLEEFYNRDEHLCYIVK